MSRGKVIRTLRASSLLSPLTEAELIALADCGHSDDYASGQSILAADDPDEYLFVLQQGRVALKLSMSPNGGQCEGEAMVELTSPGQVFGWATWIRPDRIRVSVEALEPSSLVALDLHRLQNTQAFLKVGQRMVQGLYGLLQEYGLCPPNLSALLKLGHPLLV
jgi:CRP-like cAMP-binding protein